MLLSNRYETSVVRKDLVLQAWGKWLSTLAEWDWFVTLTMRDIIPDVRFPGWTRPGLRTARRMWSEFVNYSAGCLDLLKWCEIVEISKWRDVPHIHALVEKPGIDIDSARAWAWKNWGFNRIVQYDPKMGAGFYISKYLVKEISDIRFSENFKGGGK